MRFGEVNVTINFHCGYSARGKTETSEIQRKTSVTTDTSCNVRPKRCLYLKDGLIDCN